MVADTLSKIRRNHGLEHATINVLTQRHKGFSAQGNSDHRGFLLNLYGEISEEDVRSAVADAYQRLANGEEELAIHPNCGTVLLTTSTLATLAANSVFAVEFWRSRKHGFSIPALLNVVPTAILAVAIVLLVSRPLGIELQKRYTIEGDPADMSVCSVERVTPSLITRIFQLILAGEDKAPSSYRITTTITK